MLDFKVIDPDIDPWYAQQMVGFIPAMLSEDSPFTAKQQLDMNYQHGGGWSPFAGFVMGTDRALWYPGDKPLFPFAEFSLREETILVYPHAWVAIIQEDGSYEVARMD